MNGLVNAFSRRRRNCFHRWLMLGILAATSSCSTTTPIPLTIWHNVQVPNSVTGLLGVWGSSPSNAWAVGPKSSMARWTGAAWSTALGN